MSEDSQSLPDDMVKSMRLTIVDDRFLLSTGDLVTELRIEVDASVSPPHIRFEPKDGVNRGTRFAGIYQLSGDDLVIQYSAEGNVAPSEISPSAGRDQRQSRWRRDRGSQIALKRDSIPPPGMVLVLPGTFLMGASLAESGRSDEGQHRVSISRPFWIGRNEVTVRDFSRFIDDMRRIDPSWKTDAERAGTTGPRGGVSTVKSAGHNAWDPTATWRSPGFQQTSSHPVVFVSWNDATAYCEWLSKKEGRHYRLPTEAEWEYAARGGSTTAYFWGPEIGGGRGYANLADRSYAKHFPEREFGIGFDDGFVFTAPVGSFKPNALGLHDMLGNVYEWVSDVWEPHPNTSATDPTGAATGAYRLAKGGAWGSHPSEVRSAFRFRESPDSRFAGVGFRVVADL